jgi:hypothetical protein
MNDVGAREGLLSRGQSDRPNTALDAALGVSLFHVLIDCAVADLRKLCDVAIGFAARATAAPRPGAVLESDILTLIHF